MTVERVLRNSRATMYRFLAITVVLLALAATGCSDDESGHKPSSAQQVSSPRADPTPAVEPPSTEALARLQRSLDDRYAVTAIAPADLPQTKPLVSPAEASEAPARLNAIDGVRAELPDGTTGHVFRYETKDLARLAAISLLGCKLFHGAQGCSQTVYFSGSHGDAGQRWLDDVASGLDCAGGGFRAI